VAKQGGLGDNLYVSGIDLSGDIGAVSRIGGGPAVQDVTGIDKSAMERIGLLRDGAIEYSSFFNPSPGRAHPTLSVLPTTDRIITYCRGTNLGSPSACLVAKQLNYDPTRAADGAMTIAGSTQGNGYGLEWGVQLTAGKRSDTTATNGTGVDFLAATSFGWQAYLQVFSFTGTSVTVTVQDSADNVSFAGFTSSAFTAATGVTSQRIAGASASTVRRYLRIATTGTFTQATFAVTFMKNETTVAF
jgi:hypothetical protein